MRFVDSFWLADGLYYVTGQTANIFQQNYADLMNIPDILRDLYT